MNKNPTGGSIGTGFGNELESSFENPSIGVVRESYNNYINYFVQVFTSIKENETQQMKITGVMQGVVEFEDGLKIKLVGEDGLPVFCRLENILMFIPSIVEEKEEEDESEQEEKD